MACADGFSRDLLELKKLKIHMLCPRNHRNCNIVPVGILPLLPASNPPSPASSGPSTPPHIDSPTAPSHDPACSNYTLHPTPPASSSDDEFDDSRAPLVFRSSLDKNDSASHASPSTPTRRSLSPVRTRKVAQHTSPSQPLARDVPIASDRLAPPCAPPVTGSSALPTSTFQIGPSTHRSASAVESDSDSDQCHHHPYTPSRRERGVRKSLQRDEQSTDDDTDVDAGDDDVVVPPPFAPPPCPYIQTPVAQPAPCFSLAQPAPSAQPKLAPPKMPLFPFMPLLPTPREHSPLRCRTELSRELTKFFSLVLCLHSMLGCLDVLLMNPFLQPPQVPPHRPRATTRAREASHPWGLPWTPHL
jgi:hypothetical protein